jgi:beta-glucosidase-like glycosyl hydrolase
MFPFDSFFSNRDSYNFDGFVISDCGAVQCIMTVQNYTKTVEETVAVAMHAGVDLECGQYYSKYTQAALDNKTIVESDIDQALERAFSILVRLGYFDPPEQQPYRLLNATNVNTNDSQLLALRSAQESIVLLKNLNNALPLNIDQLKNKKIALIGPTANATVLMQGDYFGKAPYLISPLLAFQTILTGILDNYLFI